MKVNINAGLVMQVCVFLLVIVLAWYFSDIFLYLFLAFIFALIGKPVAHKINTIKIFRHAVPYGLSTVITMVILMLFFALFLFFFIPMLAREAHVIANIDYDALSVNLGYLLDSLQNFLYVNNLIDEHESLVGIITAEIKKFASLAAFSNILGGLVSVTSSFLIGLFAVFFLTFFFIKDDIRIDGIAQIMFGKKHAERVRLVSDKVNRLLSRYFIGLLIEIVAMITLLYTGMALFGIRGALLMAFMGGMLNAIPYLGPLIGAVGACLFGIINCISINDYQAIFPCMLKIAGTFIGANLIDNIILQPLIYSQSIKVHPVEIFLVIIMGGTLAGIPGMLFAIPAYSIIRTSVIEIYTYVNTQEDKETNIF